MTIRSCTLNLIIVLTACNVLYAQRDASEAKLGIVNARAIVLPKPEYPQELKDLCAEGKVEIEVSIDQKGNVTKANAISGDHLLYPSAVKAVRTARFQTTHGRPVKTRGSVVYNFTNDVRCFDVGIVNEKARLLPKPVIRSKLSQHHEIKIRVIIDAESGNVILSKAENPDGSIVRAAESAARGAKFYPTADVGKVRVKGIIIYRISKNGKVTT